MRQKASAQKSGRFFHLYSRTSSPAEKKYSTFSLTFLPITRISNPVVLALIAKVNFLMINNYLMSNSLIRFPSRIVPLRNFNLSKRCR